MGMFPDAFLSDRRIGMGAANLSTNGAKETVPHLYNGALTTLDLTDQ